MITTRDLEVVEWIKYYKSSRTSAIQHFHYPSKNVCQRRLKRLFDEGYLRRCRDSLNMEYIYYVKKPIQIRHCTLLTDFYSTFDQLECVKVVSLKKEVQVGDIFPDGLMIYKHNDKNYIAFVEIQHQFNRPDIQKYINLHKSQKWEELFPVFPKVIFVTNRSFSTDKCDFKVVKIKEDLSNINKIIE